MQNDGASYLYCGFAATLLPTFKFRVALYCGEVAEGVRLPIVEL